jgi:hypothetical protein
MIFDEKFKFETHPITNIDPNQEFEVGGNKYTIAQLREVFPLQEKRFSCFIEWDDMCQYTAIGLYEILKENFDKKVEFNIYDFFTRKDYPKGIDYVKKILFPSIPEKTINLIYKEKYGEICQMSPKTDFFSRMFLAKLVYESITFCFPYYDPSLDTFVKEIQHEFFHNKVICDYVILRTDAEKKEFYIKTNFDIYVISDAGTCYDTLLTNKKEDRSIITYDNHNGINEYIISIYLLYFESNDMYGPNRIALKFLSECYENIEPNPEFDNEMIQFEQRLNEE